VRFEPLNEAQLPELMTWFPDQASCLYWGGPRFRYPFDAATFRADLRMDTLRSWTVVSGDGVLCAFGQFYLRVGRCHLGRLAVAPAQRGRGIGGTLVRGLASRGRDELGTESLSLFVLPGNERASRLYRRLGFSVVPYPEPAPELEGIIYMVAASSDLDGLPSAAQP